MIFSARRASGLARGQCRVAGLQWNGRSDTPGRGDIVHDVPDETRTVDPCTLRFLIRGATPLPGGAYGRRPYRPGLLTKTN